VLAGFALRGDGHRFSVRQSTKRRPPNDDSKGDEGPGGSVARRSRRPLNSLLLPGGFNRAILE